MSEESAAYRSQLIIYGDQPLDLPAEVKEKAIFRPGPPPAALERPGEITDATDTELAKLRAKAVLPVVASLLSEDELEDLHLAWGVPPNERDVWLHLVARGEVFEDLLDSRNYEGGGDLDAVTVAARLADHMQDWVCETTFAWGQLRAVGTPCRRCDCLTIPATDQHPARKGPVTERLPCVGPGGIPSGRADAR